MIKHILVFFVFQLIFVFSIFSQELTISGSVKDTTNNKNIGLPNAVAMLIRIKDSVLYNFKRTDADGNFSFKLDKIDTFELRISHPFFNDYSYYIFPSVKNNTFNIKQIILPNKSQLLKEVVIFAYKDPVFYKGDTLVYVADSFATRPNAVVEDLLKKLPGVKVGNDGKITAQGKEVAQVLVDGDEFFGSDPTMATKNLPANSIENVMIYEKKDENSTDDSETIQVMDLKLKDDAKKGYFGKASLASDADLTPKYPGFYEGELLFNRFDKNQKFAVFSLLSNTAKSSVDWSDMYNYGVGGDMEMDWDNMDDDFRWYSNNSVEGYPKTLKSGVFYNNKIKKKVDLNFNYTFNNNELYKKNYEHTQYLLSDSSYTSDFNNEQNERVQSHDVNMKLKWQIDSLNSIQIDPKFSVNENINNKLNINNFNNNSGNNYRNTNTSNENKSNGDKSSIQFQYKKDFKKKNRRFLTRYLFQNENNKANSKLLTDDTESSFDFNQNKDSKSFLQVHDATLTYTEPLGNKFKIETQYEYYQSKNEQSKYSYNYDGVSYSILDSNYTNEFITNKNFNRFGTTLYFDYKKHKIIGGVFLRQVVINNNNLFFNTSINQLVNNILPKFRYIYKFRQNSRFVFNYRTSSNQPSINQLQPVPDNSNPNRIQIGNPNLKPNFVQKLSANYNVYKPLSEFYIWTSVNYTSTKNAFTNHTTYDKYGRNISQTINTDGNYSFDGDFSCGIPVFNKFLSIEPNLGFSNNRSYNYINYIKNKTINTNIYGGLGFSIERDSVEFSINANLEYTLPYSSVSNNNLNPYYSQYYNIRFFWRLPFKVFIKTDANLTMNSKRANGYNLNYLIWNMSFGKNFLKKENLILSIDAYDLLNQNISASRDVSSNMVTDNKSLIIARYFLLRLVYKFNNSKTNVEDDF